MRRMPVLRRLATTSAGGDSTTDATVRVLDAARALLAPTINGGNQPQPPSQAEISEAISAVARSRNGYQAWSLYVALLQAELSVTPSDLDALAGSMLHVDNELHGDVASRRTLSVLDDVRRQGRQYRATCSCTRSGVRSSWVARSCEAFASGRANYSEQRPPPRCEKLR